MHKIKKVAVLAAGIMGASIAAHLANAGIEVLLMDMVPKYPEEDVQKNVTLQDISVSRNKFTQQAVEKLNKSKPSRILLNHLLTKLILATLMMIFTG